MKLLFVTLFTLSLHNAFSQTDSSGKKVAILPVTYINDASNGEMEEMPYRLQSEIFTFLDKKKSGFSLQQPEETNALLLKNNIGYADLRRYTTAELAAILKVQYIMRAEVTQRKLGASFSEAATSHKNKGRTNQISAGSVTEDYSNQVTLSIKNDRSEIIFDDSRKSLLPTKNAYSASLHYLLKRSPVYAN